MGVYLLKAVFVLFIYHVMIEYVVYGFCIQNIQKDLCHYVARGKIKGRIISYDWSIEQLPEE